MLLCARSESEAETRSLVYASPTAAGEYTITQGRQNLHCIDQCMCHTVAPLSEFSHKFASTICLCGEHWSIWLLRFKR
jgi:hypothetical protein